MFKYVVLCLSVSLSFAANAQGASKEALSANVEKQILALLNANSAVKGALVEVKRWAGAAKCDALQIEESTPSSFRAFATCTNPIDPTEYVKAGVGLGPSGQVHVIGTFYDGSGKNSQITVQVDHIEFAYTGE